MDHEPGKSIIRHNNVAAAAKNKNRYVDRMGEFKCIYDVILSFSFDEKSRRAANLQCCQRAKLYVFLNVQVDMWKFGKLMIKSSAATTFP